MRGKGLLIFFVEYVDANSFQLEMKRIFLFLKKIGKYPWQRNNTPHHLMLNNSNNYNIMKKIYKVKVIFHLIL